MNKIALISLSLILALVVGLAGCYTVPKPPEVPMEVLSMWHSTPSPRGFPPDLSGNVTLLPYGERGSRQDSSMFSLSEGQWIDVIVSSTDTLIYFGIEKSGEASFKFNHHLSDGGTASFGWDLMEEGNVFLPFYGKLLYENWFTDTDKGSVFTTTVRLFTWGGAQNYYLSFANFSPFYQADITYGVYKLGTTPVWGDSFKDKNLQPWLNELFQLLVSGKISEQEYDNAEAQWLDQFKYYED